MTTAGEMEEDMKVLAVADPSKQVKIIVTSSQNTLCSRQSYMYMFLNER